ncbi:MAG: hypothetical protein JWQ34_1086 [Mucilaginibacter sp.]|uniref:hypothetical protein n=1 Tax=Mucilaginibacter sp. TaxID=1882438 RepID=UPI002613307E|nr:hypothetical protein [Mucilaginibacter sp.]MDB5002861.1 hypothetical protein [Mucilaginibacter sp.]
MDFIEKIADLLDPFSAVAKYAGIAGIAIAIIFLIFREIIKKAIFPSLTKKQAYNVIRLIIICSTIIGVIGLTVSILPSYKSVDVYPKQSDSLKYEPLILKKEGVILIDSNKKR